ncbi:MAG: ABC transporter ATP-binding protein [Candidatus Heimdallarchaeota archaeon]|nr:MAG: ABC transporter ATP-binding protein [Candidatus Heimdallarchaeota archaeon]
MSEPIVEIDSLSKDYQTGEITVRALTGVDLQIEKGNFVVILGPSGSGKTTLLNLIGGIDAHTSGSIRVNTRELTKLTEKQLTEFRKEDVGFIFQFYNLIPTLTAVENVELAARLRFPRRIAYERSMKMLKTVEMDDKALKFPSQLSGGEQQRVAIARALVKEPKIVLADEPTGNLDTETGERILKEMLRICKEEGTTFLIVTHNVTISKLADYIIYLKDGQIFGTSKGQS